MRFKVGDKAVLDLHTKTGSFGIPPPSHGNMVTVVHVWGANDYDVQDGVHQWSVFGNMLKPIMEENGQYLFDFMYK